MVRKKTTTFRKLDRLHKVLIALQAATIVMIVILGLEIYRAHHRIDLAGDLTEFNRLSDKVFLLQDCLAGKEQFCPKKR